MSLFPILNKFSFPSSFTPFLPLSLPSVSCKQIDCLSEIVDTVQGRIEVYMDGGIRTGSDVLKALALGAKCVFIGRPAIWGLAYKVTVCVCVCLNMWMSMLKLKLTM